MKKITFIRDYFRKAEFKKLFILCVVLIGISLQSVFAGNGKTGYRGIYINNKGTKTWYNLHDVQPWSYNIAGYQCRIGDPGVVTFAGANLGNFSNTDVLQIAGFAIVGWTDNSDWIAGALKYKVWKQGTAEPAYTQINVGNYGTYTVAANVVGSSGGDRMVGYNNGTLNINPAATGTYNFKAQGLGQMQYVGGFWNVLNGAEMTATFTVNVPTITSVVSSLPTSSTTQTYKGATVTVTGTNLDLATIIKLGGSGGTSVTPTTTSDTTITFVVPDATSGGTVYVSDGTNSNTSAGSLTNLGNISTASTDWNTGSTWLGGAVPATSTAVTIANNITLNSAATNNPTSITVNASSGITFGNSGSVTASTITNNGTLDMSNGGILNIAAGTFTNNATFTRGTGTINFTGNVTVAGTVGFNNVTLTGGVNFGTSSTINGLMTLNIGGYVNTNAPTYASGSTLKYNTGDTYGRTAEWSATSGRGYPYNVQISGNTTLNIGSGGTGIARQCAGNLIVDAGSTFSMNVTGSVMTAAVTVLGDVINNGTITLSGSGGGDLVTQGNITDSGTFNANNRAVFFTGSNTQVIQGTGVFDISYVRIQKSGGSVQLATNLTCTGPTTGNAMTIEGANSVLDLNGYTLFLGMASVNSTINSGIATPGSIMGSPTSNISIIGNGALGTIRFKEGYQSLNNLTIDRQSSGTVTLGSPLTIAGHLAITNGTLTSSSNLISVAPGAKLTINTGQTLSAGGGVTLQSDATGTATMLNSGTLTGTVNVQQYLGSARNWYISSPVTTTNSPSTNITRYYEYVEAGNNDPAGQPEGSTVYWKGYNTGHAMAVGKGYIAQAGAVTTIQFSGTPNNGNITTAFNLTRDDYKGKGFNLVGNPYPSYIDWNDVVAANQNLDNTYYYRTKNIDNTYAFVTWNGSGNTFVNSRGGTANTAITSFIPPTQAFWVRVKSGTASTTMNFTNAMRDHRDDNSNLMKVRGQNTRTSVRIQLQNGTESDELLIYQDAGANNGYDSYDSPKMQNNSAITPDVYTKVGDEKLVINGLNTISENMELTLGFSLNAPSTMKIKATELNNLPEGTGVYLLDKVANTQTKLTEESEYSFTTTERVNNNESRFSLLFRAPDVTTDAGNVDKEQISVFVNAQNKITVIAPKRSIYMIYNAMGQLFEKGVLNSDIKTQNSNLISGVYMVKVNNITTRVLVK